MRLERVRFRDLIKTEFVGRSRRVAQLDEELGTVYLTYDEPRMAHFMALFARAIVVRDYSWNPIVGDIFTIHEGTHIALFQDRFDVDQPWEAWRAKRISEERAASFATEVDVYFDEDLPGLREMTFKHRIFVDRYLQDPFVDYLLTPGTLRDRIMIDRWNILESGRPPQDFIEEQLQNYDRANKDWVTEWSLPVGVGRFKDEPAWLVVERFMAEHGGRPPLTALIEWLMLVMDDKGVPFPVQGDISHRHYLETKRRYGNHLLAPRRLRS